MPITRALSPTVVIESDRVGLSILECFILETLDVVIKARLLGLFKIIQVAG